MSALGVRKAIHSSISWVSFVLDMLLCETDVIFNTFCRGCFCAGWEGRRSFIYMELNAKLCRYRRRLSGMVGYIPRLFCAWDLKFEVGEWILGFSSLAGGTSDNCSLTDIFIRSGNKL
jgi:hypothetical protein